MKIELEDLTTAIIDTEPSIRGSDKAEYAALYKRFQNGDKQPPVSIPGMSLSPTSGKSKAKQRAILA